MIFFLYFDTINRTNTLASLAPFVLTKIFEKKKCVSIDSKCSETHRNAKHFFTPLTDYALCAQRKARAA